LEAAGAILVLFVLSWQLAPACSLVIVVSAVAAALYRRSTRPMEQSQSIALQVGGLGVAPVGEGVVQLLCGTCPLLSKLNLSCSFSMERGGGQF
jgi:membrane protein implicated in regulation of membrane protease activity